MVNNYKRAVAAVKVIACARAAEGNVKVKLIVSDLNSSLGQRETPGIKTITTVKT